MKCRQVRRVLYEFVEGSLAEEQAACVGGHLRSCPECSRRVAAERRLAEGLRRGFADWSSALIQGRVGPAARPRLWLQPLPAALLVLLAASLVSLFSFFRPLRLTRSMPEEALRLELQRRILLAAVDAPEGRPVVVMAVDSRGRVLQ